MESKIQMEVQELLFILMIISALAILGGMLIGAGAVNTKHHYISGQQSCAVCEVKNAK